MYSLTAWCRRHMSRTDDEDKATIFFSSSNIYAVCVCHVCWMCVLECVWMSVYHTACPGSYLQNFTLYSPSEYIVKFVWLGAYRYVWFVAFSVVPCRSNVQSVCTADGIAIITLWYCGYMFYGEMFYAFASAFRDQLTCFRPGENPARCNWIQTCSWLTYII